MSTSQPAGHLIVECLLEQGMEIAFGVPGESFLAVLDGFHAYGERARFIVNRQEGGAAFMAEAHGKLTGRPGICFVTRGPGATNASIGVHNAFQDSTPMVLFVGDVGSDFRDREAFQEVDYGSFFGPSTKGFAKRVERIDDANRIPEYIARAFSTAMNGRPGPVVLVLPEDMLRSETAARRQRPMKQFARTATLAAIVGLGALLPALAGAEAAYPSKPIRVIVPFAAGSTTDIIARAIADKMGASMGQPLVIENRGGASGTIGQQAVATAAADGYTVMIHSSSHTVSPSTFAKLPFDTVNDFAGVTPISSLPNALVIAPSKNIKTLPQLLAAARAKPGSMNFASAGQGSATHLNAEKFKMAAKIDATNIPFKGSGEAVTEVLSGRVDYYFSPIAPVIGQIKEGQLLALAVGSPKRAAALPDVPTTAEAGVPGSEFNFWIGMMAPAKTPRAVVDRLHDEVAKALATPEVKERFLKLGADAWTLKPAQFDAYIKQEIASNAELVKAAGLAVQQ